MEKGLLTWEELRDAWDDKLFLPEEMVKMFSEVIEHEATERGWFGRGEAK